MITSCNVLKSKPALKSFWMIAPGQSIRNVFLLWVMRKEVLSLFSVGMLEAVPKKIIFAIFVSLDNAREGT